MPRTRTSLIAVIAFAALIVACSDDPEPAATATPTAAAAASTATSTATTAGAGAAGGAGVGAALAGGRFCGDWATLASQSARLTTPSTSPADIKQSVDTTTTYLKTLGDTAPSEIKADFQVFAKFWSEFATVLAKANYDMMKVATDPEAQKAMQAMAAPELQQAGTNITTWVQKNCTAGR